jgi:uncharacterized ferritin-like protein (DUF455 family)
MSEAALLSVRDAAQILFGSRDHQAYKKVLKLIHDDELRHIPLGSRYYVSRASIEERL